MNSVFSFALKLFATLLVCSALGFAAPPNKHKEKIVLEQSVSVPKAAAGQAVPHTVTLTWSDTNNPAGTKYKPYRADGTCSATSQFISLSSPITGLTYTDSTVVAGKTYCYAVTATDPTNQESAFSNTGAAIIPALPPTAPTNLKVVVN